MTKASRWAAVLLMGVTVAGIVYLAGALFTKDGDLPVLGEPGHVAGGFSFVNQDGRVITEKDVAGKVTVVEYFFTTCPGICKQMSANLQVVYEKYRDRPGFAILSHTVDPETDSVRVLKAYADQLQVNNANWQFLTGDKYALYRAAREEYLLAVEDTDKTGTTEDFLHTQYVSLLDKERRIRGFYDATDKAEMEKLMEDIEGLL